MQLKLIEERLRRRFDITALNPMQQQMAAIDASHIILLSPTGSGKTVAFALAMLKRLNASTTADGAVQAVVLAPSRELVLQIAEVIRPLAAGLKTVALYGGHAVADEVKSLATPVPDIIIATPGRLLDHLRRGNVSIFKPAALVIDEYDKSLELGFHDEMKQICKRMQRPGFVVLTSATEIADMPDFLDMNGAEILNFSHPLGAARKAAQLQTVRVDSPQRDKADTLITLLRSLPQGRAMVFVNHRESAERLHDILKRTHLPVGIYHGGMEQRERQLAVDKFTNGTTPILVTTDLAARGLDIDDVSYVIHYHMPVTPEAWTHRNGRTARMGASGTVYSIIAEDENIPEYVTWQRLYAPTGEGGGITSDVSTIYFNAGKKEKISRGDIVGYLIQRGGLDASQIGKITVYDHSAVAAVPTVAVSALLARLAPHKLKNTRVKVTAI